MKIFCNLWDEKVSAILAENLNLFDAKFIKNNHERSTIIKTATNIYAVNWTTSDNREYENTNQIL